MHFPLGDQLDYKTNTEVMNVWKSYNYENCGVKIYAKEDHRSCEKKAWKKIQAFFSLLQKLRL